MSESGWPLQQALFARLAADAGVNALVGAPPRIFDQVPQDAAFPYLVIGEAVTAPFETKTERGSEETLVVHCWSRYRGLKETKEIMAAVRSALDGAALSVAGHELVLLDFLYGATALEPDGLTRHGVQRFRAVTQVG